MHGFRKSNRRRPTSMVPREILKGGEVPLAAQEVDELKTQSKKGMYAVICIMAAFAVVMARLYFLQIEHGDEYDKLAASNRVRYMEIVAPRGNITDRRGREQVGGEGSRKGTVFFRHDQGHVIAAAAFEPGADPAGQKTGRGRYAAILHEIKFLIHFSFSHF